MSNRGRANKRIISMTWKSSCIVYGCQLNFYIRER